jgi:deoxyribonucleoside regulator
MNDNLKIRVSRLYYFSDMSKTEIGQRLGISRFQVSRLLEQARQDGIVRIQIVDPGGNNAGIEEQLEKRFDLYQAIVVNPAGQSDETIMKAIGSAAAERLINLINDGDVLGLTWGATVNEVVEALPPKVEKDIQVVQIMGGLNQIALNVNAIDLVRRVAEVYGAKSYFLHSPAMVSNPALRGILLADSGIRETVDMFDDVTVALSGIGAFTAKGVSNLMKAGYIGNDDLARLRELKAVGDVFAHFFDITGRICDTELEQRIIGMGIEQLKKVRYSIGVAGGVHKSLAILGALRGRLINILVTDYATATDILDKDAVLS